MCLGLKAVTDPIISALLPLEPDVSLEKVVHSDYSENKETNFIKCWWIGSMVKFVWECFCREIHPDICSLIGIMRADCKLYKTIDPLSTKYVKMENLIENISSCI